MSCSILTSLHKLLQFYFPKGAPLTEKQQSELQAEIDGIWIPHPEGLPLQGGCLLLLFLLLFSSIEAHLGGQKSIFVCFHSLILPPGFHCLNPSHTRVLWPCPAFMDVTKNVCRLPSFFNGVLFKKLEKEGSNVVTKEDFLRFWVSESLVDADQNTRLFAVLKQPGKNHLTQVQLNLPCPD